MSMLVQIPASDRESIDALCALPGAKRIDQSRFDGADYVRILIELAVAARATESVAKSAARTAKSIDETVATLRSIFRAGVRRHRDDPDRDFAVSAGGNRYLDTNMSDVEIDRRLSELNADDDRFA